MLEKGLWVCVAFCCLWASNAEAAVSVKAGEYIHFGRWRHFIGTTEGPGASGSYESTAQPILWHKEASDGAFYSRYLIDAKQMQPSGSVTGPSSGERWRNSELYEFLNGAFHSDAFTLAEKRAILTVPTLDGEESFGTRVTLPSGSEYGPGAWKKEPLDSEAVYAWYWTRFVANGILAAAVNPAGELANRNIVISLGVRPVFFLNTTPLVFKAPFDFSSAADTVGSAGNPYVLYSKGTKPTLTLEANGKLKLQFASAIDIIGKKPTPEDFDLLVPPGTVGEVEVSESGYILLSPNVAVTDGVRVLLHYTVSADGGALTGGAIATKGTTEALGSDTWEIEPAVTEPVPITDGLFDLLAPLNIALAPEVSVAPLDGPRAITRALSSDVDFRKKTAPTKKREGYENLLPSFFSTVALSSFTKGSALSLSLSLSLRQVAGFDGWANLGDAERTALLNTQKVSFAYELDGTWTPLIGADGILDWSSALSKGVVRFGTSEIVLNYEVTDAMGNPYALDDRIVVPDSVEDGEIIDPIWLMKETASAKIIPQAMTLSPVDIVMDIGATAKVRATFMPFDATERELDWKVENERIARVTRTVSPDVYAVSGLSGGETRIVAEVRADRSVVASLTVEVLSEDHSPAASKPGGCDAQESTKGPASLLLLAAVLICWRFYCGRG